MRNILSQLLVPNLIECAFQCINNAHCTNFNYRHVTLSMKPWNCEIIGNKTESSVQVFERNSGYTFYEAIEVTLHFKYF